MCINASPKYHLFNRFLQFFYKVLFVWILTIDSHSFLQRRVIRSNGSSENNREKVPLRYFLLLATDSCQITYWLWNLSHLSPLLSLQNTQYRSMKTPKQKSNPFINLGMSLVLLNYQLLSFHYSERICPKHRNRQNLGHLQPNDAKHCANLDEFERVALQVSLF